MAGIKAGKDAALGKTKGAGGVVAT